MRRFILILALLMTSVMAHAQSSGIEDAYDPFADYSDFVEASTEETDINFFKYGRMLSLGGSIGYRSFTETQADLYTSDIFYGLFFTYYMSLQFAIQASLTSGSNDMGFKIPERNYAFTASTRHIFYSFHGKYFLNTQNLTKAISKFNPFIIGGLSRIDRETSDRSQTIFAAKDFSASFDIGAGLEYLFNNNSNFITAQLMYHRTDFSNESRELFILDPDHVNVGIFPRGDILQLQVMIGFNF